MSTSSNYIKYILLFYFLIRLVGITNPPLETNHNWRQATGLMVARNFLEVNNNIFYPRVDETNGGTGIIGMEFPSLNYTYYLTSKVFGHSHWYGRLINLIFSTLGLLYFFRTLRFTGFNEKAALASTVILASSIWFAFSRKMMPDTYCISLMFIGLYYGFYYLKTNNLSHVLLYTVITTLATLSKIPAGIYFITLLPAILSQNNTLESKTKLIAASTIPVSAVYLWYFKWNPFLSKEYGSWYNSGKSLSEGFAELSSNIPNVLDNFYFDSFHSYILFTAFIFGLIIAVKKRHKKVYITFTLVSAVFAVYILKSGHYFYHHNYYIIPFVPVMAIVSGYALSLIKPKWLFILVLTAGSIEAIANQQHDFFIKDSEVYRLELEQILDQVSEPIDLIAINGNGNPQLIYLSHRKGWNCSNEELSSPDFIKKINKKGCKFIVIDKHSFAEFSAETINAVYEDASFIIYSLK